MQLRVLTSQIHQTVKCITFVSKPRCYTVPSFSLREAAMNIVRGFLGLSLCLLCGSVSGLTALAQTAAPVPPPPAAAPPAPPTPVAFDAALLKAANDLFS